MKKLILIIAILSISMSIQAQTESEVKALHSQYDRAVEQKDSLMLNRLFHDKMMITGGDGTLRTKHQEISDCIDARYNVLYFKTNNPEVSIFDNTAILRGDLEWQLKNGDRVMTLKRRITFTYTRLNGQWIIVAQHIGMMPR